MQTSASLRPAESVVTVRAASLPPGVFEVPRSFETIRVDRQECVCVWFLNARSGSYVCIRLLRWQHEWWMPRVRSTLPRPPASLCFFLTPPRGRPALLNLSHSGETQGEPVHFKRQSARLCFSSSCRAFMPARLQPSRAMKDYSVWSKLSPMAANATFSPGALKGRHRDS